MILIAKTITITGSINLAGGAGGSATLNGYFSNFGGGGGSGGACLLKAQVATLGTTKITAAGGNGGATGGNSAYQQAGGNGSSGRIHLDYLTSYTGTTTPSIDVRQDTSLVNRFTSPIMFF
jgi:hypothetical protein